MLKSFTTVNIAILAFCLLEVTVDGIRIENTLQSDCRDTYRNPFLYYADEEPEQEEEPPQDNGGFSFDDESLYELPIEFDSFFEDLSHCKMNDVHQYLYDNDYSDGN